MCASWASLFFKDWVKINNKYFDPNTSFKSTFELFNNEHFKILFRNAPVVVLVVNHIEHKYEFFSESVYSMLGYTPEEFYKGSVQFGLSLIHPDHAVMFSKYVLPAKFEAYNTHRFHGNLKKMRLSYNFKIKRKDETYIWVCQQTSVIETDNNGNPVLSIYFMSDITHMKKDEGLDFSVALLDEKGVFCPLVISNFPVNDKKYDLSGREIEILGLLGQGHSSKKIAEMLNLSLHTINTHRKNMLDKTNSKNTSELLSQVMSKGLL